MSMACRFHLMLLHPLQNFCQIMATGGLTRIVYSSKPLTFFLHAIKCLPRRLTIFSIYGLPLWLPTTTHCHSKTIMIFTQQSMLRLYLGVTPTGSLSTSAFILTRSSPTMPPIGRRPNGMYGIETPANSLTTCFKIQISVTNLTTFLTKSTTLTVIIAFIM